MEKKKLELSNLFTKNKTTANSSVGKTPSLQLMQLSRDQDYYAAS